MNPFLSSIRNAVLRHFARFAGGVRRAGHCVLSGMICHPSQGLKTLVEELARSLKKAMNSTVGSLDGDVLTGRILGRGGRGGPKVENKPPASLPDLACVLLSSVPPLTTIGAAAAALLDQLQQLAGPDIGCGGALASGISSHYQRT